jgi:IS30 family transposase
MELGRSQSSLRREVARNAWPYDAEAAQQRAEALKRSRQRRKLDPGPLREEVDRRLRRFDSPEQIAGRLKIDFAGGAVRISHETIYKFIAQVAAEGVDYTPFLRFGIRKRRYGYRGKSKYQRIRNGRPIEERPAAAADRQEFGHFESDTVKGKASSPVGIATHLERKTRFLIAALLPDRSATTYNRKTSRAFARHLRMEVKTLTVDNGMEFSKHRQMEKALGARVYFAHPYRAWERGANENTNGLLRQFFPKKTDLSLVAPQQLQEAVDNLNSRPRKCLGYRTPAEALQEEICALGS